MKYLSNPAVRAYVYRVALAVIAVLVGYGVLSESEAPVWIGLVAALLPTTLAVANTSTHEDDCC